MLRTIYFVIYFIGHLIYTVPFKAKVKRLHAKGMKKEANELSQRVAFYWAQRLIKATGSKVTVIGSENVPKEGGVVFVGNHQSYFDVPLIVGFIDKPMGFIAKEELANYPIFSSWLGYLGCVFIKRNDARESLKAINKGAELVKEGHSMVIFPEGTRSPDGKIGEFKPGSLKLATKAGAPIVPVTLKGAFEILPKGGKRIRPSNVEIIISPPIYKKEKDKNDTTDVSLVIKEIISKNLGA